MSVYENKAARPSPHVEETGKGLSKIQKHDLQHSLQKNKLSVSSSVVVAIIFLLTLLILLTIGLFLYFTHARPAKPHVLLIAADDLGWGDVGWHSSDINTPTLSKLAKDGVILNQFYSQPICTASRAALLTGRYPFKMGLHGSRPLLAGAPGSIPLDVKTMSQELKDAGYSTNLIGKWHLGFETLQHTPIMRGFDTFTGFYNGMQDYFTHTTSGFDTIEGVGGYDMRYDHFKGKTPVIDEILWNKKGTFNGYIFDETAKKVIENHNKDVPLFMMMAYPNPHTPIQVPDIFTEENEHIVNDIRKKFAGIVYAMDESVRNITETLRSRNMLENTIIIFISDNGGTLVGHGNNPTGSSNYPLRGEKATLWEGGSRVPAFFSGHGIPSNKIVDEMFHITDLYPTIMDMLGIDIKKNRQDGVKQTDIIKRDSSKTSREYFIYDIDPVYKQAAIRYHNWKLILGFGSLKLIDACYPPLTDKQTTIDGIMDMQEFTKRAFKAIGEYKAKGNMCKTSQCFYPDKGNMLKNVLLYDLSKDQYEFNNIASKHPDIVHKLLDILDREMEQMVEPVNLLTPGDKAASPNNFNGTWQPWLK